MAEPDTRQVVLRGVYEDNLGLPRSSTGKRRLAAEPNATGAGNASGRTRGRVAIAALLACIALLGLELRIFIPVGRQAEAESMTPRTDFNATSSPTSQLRAESSPSTPQEPVSLLDVAPSPATYDAMLSRLDVPVADLFDLKVRTIVIDPGHGGSDPGAIGPTASRRRTSLSISPGACATSYRRHGRYQRADDPDGRQRKAAQE